MITPVNNYLFLRKREIKERSVLIVNTCNVDNIAYVEASSNPIFKVNDIVIYKKDNVIDLNIGDGNLIICKESDIFAIIDDQYE